MQKIVLILIKFYQKYLTILSYGSCRYYPTCSSYAKMQFENNNFFQALYFSTLRILKCNPLFDGGFDYVKTKCPLKKQIKLKFKKLKFKRIKVKYWQVPVDSEYCLILQHNQKWDK